ncbi:MAG: HAD family hydrolase [Dehalococcoidia bacterium]
MAVRAVLFDLGDTLWHFPEMPPADEIRGETMRRIYALLRSWDVEPEGELRFLGRDIRLTVTEAVKQAYEGDFVEPDCPGIARDVAAAKGLTISQEQADQLWDAWNLGGAFLNRRLFHDALHMLETLQQRGYRLGSVTNRTFGGPRFLEEVDELGLADYFEVISISCDLGYMKPRAEIFEHALDALAIEPQEVVMVGDSLKADVGGAQALGMTAVWRRLPKTKEEVDGIKPDFIIDELREIPDLPCFRPD